MKTKIKLLFVLLLSLSLLTLTIVRIDKEVDLYAETSLKNSVNSSINAVINRYIKDNAETFAKATTREYDDDGSLVCITVNAAVVNGIQTELERDITASLIQIENAEFGLPIGNLSGIKLLADSGPCIKMKIAPLGTLTCGTINTFDSVGINHTLHKVGLEFKISFKAAAPFSSARFETKFFVLICESIIIGKVPEVYFN